MVEKHELAEKDYMLGMKYKDIADKYGVTINTVKSWKKRHGWQKGLKKGAKKTAHKKEKGCTQKREAPIINNVPTVVKHRREELTEKQQLFCLYYIKNFNATQAYLKAYGCNYNVANAEGYKLLVKPCVKEEISRLKEIKRQSIMLDPDDIVERYMRIAFADMTDVVTWGSEDVLDRDENWCIQIDPNGDYKTRKQNYLDFKNSNQVDGGLVCEVSMGRSGMKVKLEDRQKALAWLSDYFNMNPMNKHRVSFDNAVLGMRERELKLKEF